MRGSDLGLYMLALLLGVSAGLAEVRLGDFLFTALIVSVSTLVLGSLRPTGAWRWALLVGAGVPLVRLVAYAWLGLKPYRAQIWESFLGFATGTAGSYAGVLARKGIDELLRSRE
ncbi:MAG: hypothetical protein JO356_04645 [Acidobacteria bacterium]|nr:hypothetical protein [Acidobacteriota bacterium]